MLTLMLVAWGQGTQALTERFADVRQLWPGQDPGQTYQGFIQAWRKAGLALAYAAARHHRQALAAAAAAARSAGWIVLAVDGSHFELPRTAAQARVFGTTGRGTGAPQLWVTLLWHLGLGLPWAWKVGRAHASERHHLRDLLAQTPPGCLLTMDAGFTGYDLLGQIRAGGRHFLVRVGRHVRLLRELGYYQEERTGLVYLWPTYAQRNLCPPLVLRLIRLPRTRPQGPKMYLRTSVLDRAALSAAQAGTIYRRRWGMELTYRALKQTLQARKLRSHAPVQALLEMHGLLLGLMLLGRWTRQALGSGGAARSWSPAQALRAVRPGLHRPDLRRDWTAALARARPDGYRRRRKTRVDWPRKKQHDPPPGRPHCRRATPAERRHAANLSPQ